MFAALFRMGNANAVSYHLKFMIILLACGVLFPNVSNAGHAGWFPGGWLVRYLFGPEYKRSYVLKMAKGITRGTVDVKCRHVLGPGI